MKDTIYLIADVNGVTRMTKRAPGLHRNEVAVRVTVTIPASAFRSSVFGATLDVPEDRLVQPDITITADDLPEPEAPNA